MFLKNSMLTIDQTSPYIGKAGDAGGMNVYVTEVARRLGYSDATAFSHAFRRWTGRAASDFRR